MSSSPSLNSSTSPSHDVPIFDKKIEGKIHPNINIEYRLQEIGDGAPSSRGFATTILSNATTTRNSNWDPAIATFGLPIHQRVDRTCLFSVKLKTSGNVGVMIGFVPFATWEHSAGGCYPGISSQVKGISLNTYDGSYYPAGKRYSGYATPRKEEFTITVVLRISEGGTKKTIQWIVDDQPEKECPQIDCTEAMKLIKPVPSSSSSNSNAIDEKLYHFLSFAGQGSIEVEVLPATSWMNLDSVTKLTRRLTIFFEKYAPYNLGWRTEKIAVDLYLNWKNPEDYWRRLLDIYDADESEIPSPPVSS